MLGLRADVGSADDCAGLVATGYITGSTVNVDGGLIAMHPAV